MFRNNDKNSGLIFNQFPSELNPEKPAKEKAYVPASSRVVLEAPMSFAGSTERTVNWLWRDKPPAVQWGLGLWLIPIVLFWWWMMIFLWYMSFGLFVVPYRMQRRTSRLKKREDMMHKELLTELRRQR